MYAIVEIAGQQFKIEKDQQIYVHRLDAKEGSKVSFDQVLLTENAGKVKVGAPVIQGAKVTAKVLEHLKDDKVIVFKKKRRKGYRVKNGHRQSLTKLEVLKIEDKAPSVKKEVKPTAIKSNTKKTVAKEPTAKKSNIKKTVAKKPAAKNKTTAKKAE